MNDELRDMVRRRAHFRCEYCQLPEADSPVTPHHIEHIVARKHRGSTKYSNLALACHRCNSFKATDLSGLDPTTGKITKLFHPRRHRWHRHFLWDTTHIVGRTAIGRTTVGVLNMNNPERLRLRESLAKLGRFPWPSR